MTHPLDAATVDRVVTAIETATARFVDAVAALDPEGVRRSSGLPGWSRGHVATHVANNAPALANLLHNAATGDTRPMYAGRAEREAAIEAGAGRPAATMVADLRESARVFADAARAVPMDRWDVPVHLMSGRAIAARTVLPHRMREVEFHHVDLDVGYTPAHWDTGFVTACLDDLVTTMSEQPGVPRLILRASDGSGTHTWTVHGDGGPVSISGPRAALLAWVAGRSPGDGLLCSGADVLPMLPAWP
jgi:maleylpyruvate isomerase